MNKQNIEEGEKRIEERRMVILDLDDTTLTSQKTISKESAAYLSHLQDQGVFVTFASGRPYRAMQAYYELLKLKGKVVCANGGEIIDPSDHDKITYQKHFPKDIIWKIIYGVGLDNFKDLMIEDGQRLFIAFDNHTMDSFCYKQGMEVIVGDHFREIQNPNGACFVMKDRKGCLKLASLGATSAYPDVGLRFWADSTVGELYFNSVNKATGMLELAKEEGIRQDDIIAFGDADNDIEMLYRAGIGVAMKNGSPNAQHYADLVSLDDNDHDGVRKTLQLLLPGV